MQTVRKTEDLGAFLADGPEMIGQVVAWGGYWAPELESARVEGVKSLLFAPVGLNKSRKAPYKRLDLYNPISNVIEAGI